MFLVEVKRMDKELITQNPSNIQSSTYPLLLKNWKKSVHHIYCLKSHLNIKWKKQPQSTSIQDPHTHFHLGEGGGDTDTKY